MMSAEGIHRPWERAGKCHPRVHEEDTSYSQFVVNLAEGWDADFQTAEQYRKYIHTYTTTITETCDLEWVRIRIIIVYTAEGIRVRHTK